MLLKIGDWNVSPALNQLERNGETLKLEPRAMELLVYLASTRGRVVPADELLREVWKGRVFDDGVVYKNINHLRKALNDDSQHPRFIQTIPKRGYRLVATVDHGDGDAQRRPEVERNGVAPEARHAVVAPNATKVFKETRGGLRRWQLLLVGAAVSVAAIVVWRFWRGDAAQSALGNVVGSQKLTSYPGDETEPSWSPDGQRVAFVRRTMPEGSRIEVVQRGSTESLRVSQATQERQRSPRWSPKDNRIAFLRQRDITEFDLMIVDAFGGQERKVGSATIPLLGTTDAMPFLTWTPDGSGLVFTSASTGSKTGPSYSLHLLSLDSGAPKELGLLGDPNEYDTAPAFSADGRYLAFVRYRFNERVPRLMVQDLGPGLRPQGAPQSVPGLPAGTPRCPVWAPDNQTLTFTVGLQLREWRRGGQSRVAYTLPPSLPGGLDIVWRDGRARVAGALAKGNLDLWALPIDPVEHVAAGPPVTRIHSTAMERHPSFSAGGQLAYTSTVSGHEEVYVSDANGNGSRRLSDLQAGIVSSPRWSPDGEQIAFFAVMPPEGKFVVHVVDVAGGLPRPIFTGGYTASWSVDGRYVYVGRPGTQSRTVRVSVANGQPEDLFEGDGAVETADGRQVLYSKSGKWGIFARSLDGSPGDNPERPLVDDYTPARAAIVPTAGGFYYLSHSRDSEPRAFEFFDFDSQTKHDVGPAPARIDVGMTLSPNGKELVYPAPALDDDFDLAEFEAR